MKIEERNKEYSELHKSKYLSPSNISNIEKTKVKESVDTTKLPYLSYINSSNNENYKLSNRKRKQIENMLEHERGVAKKLNSKISRNISILQKEKNNYDVKLLK